MEEVTPSSTTQYHMFSGSVVVDSIISSPLSKAAKYSAMKGFLGSSAVELQDVRANTAGGGSRGSLEIQCDLKKLWCYCMIENSSPLLFLGLLGIKQQEAGLRPTHLLSEQQLDLRADQNHLAWSILVDQFAVNHIPHSSNTLASCPACSGPLRRNNEVMLLFSGDPLGEPLTHDPHPIKRRRNVQAPSWRNLCGPPRGETNTQRQDRRGGRAAAVVVVAAAVVVGHRLFDDQRQLALCPGSE
ncbi:hypothetical protein INR49_017703 [Caranx melampygus]|nr:hypothetical protein INR49_017703 [Caranx melampygus]